MDADRVIFTSGGTESNNMALRGITRPRGESAGHIVISPIEHPSIALLAEQLARTGWQVDRLPVDNQGRTLVDGLDDLLREDTRLVSVMLGNNETGVLQPVAELASRCRELGIPLHTDAVQCVGKIPVDFRALGVAALTLTAHKFHGPLGIGALVVRHDVAVEPWLVGGFQQASLRPGTESVALAVGMAKALELCSDSAASQTTHLRQLRDQLEQGVMAHIPEARIIGQQADRLPHTSNIAFAGFDRQALSLALDMAGVACSTGSACASGSSEPSPVLVAMGCDASTVGGSLRFSVGRFTTTHDIDLAIERISNCCNKLRRIK
jgi:cysteine desulfurase